MTVKELVEKLKTMDQDAVVVLSRDSEYRELREDEINEIDQIFDADKGEQIDGNFVDFSSWD